MARRVGSQPAGGGTRRGRRQVDAPTVDDGSRDVTTDDANAGRQQLSAEQTAIMNAFYDRVEQRGLVGIRGEYTELKAVQPPDPSTNACRAFAAANRYLDQPCYDWTRVQLTFNRPADGHYIHANWVDLPGVGVRFILTQGPLRETVNDFWRMVYQERVQSIAVLCHWEENGKPKCFAYFPGSVGMTMDYGLLQVKYVKNERADKAFERYSMEVWEKGQQSLGTLKITVYQWRNWPDRGIPNADYGLLRLAREIRAKKLSNAVIHCSAGVGRTGTLMSIIVVLARIAEQKPFQLYDIVKDLRMRRYNSVQTESQYVYLYRLVCEYIRLKGLTRPSITQFINEAGQYLQNATAMGDAAPPPNPSARPMQQSPN